MVSHCSKAGALLPRTGWVVHLLFITMSQADDFWMINRAVIALLHAGRTDLAAFEIISSC